MDEKIDIKAFCTLCASSFDSQDTRCQKCEHYQEGLHAFGRTISNEECQLAMLLGEMERWEQAKKERKTTVI